MKIPLTLQNAIEEEISRFGLNALINAQDDLSIRYRSESPHQRLMNTEIHRCAYIASRMPATFAAVSSVLNEIRLRLPEVQFNSLLDLGAGPGTVMWAASEVFSEINKIVILEQDVHLSSIGQRLAAKSENTVLEKACWKIANLEQPQELPLSDLVVLSYSIGELSKDKRMQLLKQCWNATNKLLVIIEPGTPQGFERIRAIREELISLGSNMVAPCPHQLKCPMASDDWCHFSARLERSSLHRRLKGGSLGHEDEKFSYVAVSKTSCTLPNSRILRHPQKRSGHIGLTLCAQGGVEEKIVSKRTPEVYKQVKKLEWGDAFAE